VLAYRAGLCRRLVERLLRPAWARESLANARHAFRSWRRTRPFWGGLLIIAGASELLLSEQAPLPVVTYIGIHNPGAYLTPAFMLMCGLLLWLTPIARSYHSVLAILLALWSWITSNLGGFFIGMLIGAIGGALAFAWTADTEDEPSGLPRKPRIGWPSLARTARTVTSRLKARVARPLFRRPSRPVET